MRITNLLPDIQYQIQQSQQQLATASEQMSTGLRVNQLSDDPVASANMVASLAVSASVDSYTSNINSVLPQMQTADSAMSSMVTSLNTAITLGTQGANGTNSAANTQEIEAQVEGLLTDIVAQGNTSFQGVYLFGGTANTTPPFVAASETYTSAQGTAANPLSVGVPPTPSVDGDGTLLTAGTTTTITDAGVGAPFTFTAQAGDTVKNLMDAINQAATAGVLPNTVTATLNGSGHLVVADSANNLTMTSSDAVLGGINATNAKTATSASGSLVEGTTAFVAGNGTVMTAGSTTTISDATTGEQLTFVAKAGDTLANLNAAIGAAVTAGTLSAGTTATINAATGQLSIGTNSSTLGIAVETNDPALGAMTAVPGSAVANAYAYVGNSGVNSVQVGDSTDVPTNVAGNQLLTSGANVIGSLNKLITALQSGSLAQVGDATNGISAALSYVSQQRVPLDNTITRLNSQESYLSQETLNLTTQQTALVGIPLADAATNFSQAQLDNSAVLGAAAKALPQTLLQYLQ